MCEQCKEWKKKANNLWNQVMQNAHKMRMQYTSSMQQTQAENETLFQTMVARNEELAQRWVDVLPGRPFIDLRLRRF